MRLRQIAITQIYFEIFLPGIVYINIDPVILWSVICLDFVGLDKSSVKFLIQIQKETCICIYLKYGLKKKMRIESKIFIVFGGGFKYDNVYFIFLYNYSI